MRSVTTSHGRQRIHRRPRPPTGPPRDGTRRWDIAAHIRTGRASVPRRVRLAIPDRHNAERLAGAASAAQSVAIDLSQTCHSQLETHEDPSLAHRWFVCDQRAFFASCICSYERERRRQRTSCAIGHRQRGTTQPIARRPGM
jgi:hypothetical protein